MGQRPSEASEGDTVRVSDALRHEGSPGSPREALREFQLWLLVDAHRWLVIAVLSLAIFCAVVAAVLLSPPSVATYISEGTAIAKGYVELQTVAVTVITIVLAINQLVLSPELGSVGRQRSRLNDALENRARVEELTDAPTTPTDPDHYLRALLAAARERSHRLRDAVAESDDRELRRGVERYDEEVSAETERIRDALDGREFGTIALLGAAMHFTTAEKIHAIRDLHAKHEGELPAETDEAFAEMLAVLELFTVAREYFRALYVQWEFIDFSRSILYFGLPAVVVAHLSIGLIDGNAVTGSLFGLPTQVAFEAFLFTVAVLPVVVLISYAARLSTLAKATVFISPFSPEREGGHWEE